MACHRGAMKVTFELSSAEIKEAILYYLQENRPDLIMVETPAITFEFFPNMEHEANRVKAVVSQHTEVHEGKHPYR